MVGIRLPGSGRRKQIQISNLIPITQLFRLRGIRSESPCCPGSPPRSLHFWSLSLNWFRLQAVDTTWDKKRQDGDDQSPRQELPGKGKVGAGLAFSPECFLCWKTVTVAREAPAPDRLVAHPSTERKACCCLFLTPSPTMWETGWFAL